MASYAKIPNALICDTTLSRAAFTVALALYSHHNALGQCRKSYDDLIALAGIKGVKSRDTVSGAIQELVDKNYITYARTRRYDRDRKTVIYGKNSYSCTLSVAKGFTMVPCGIFKLGLSSSELRICVFLLKCKDNTEHRAYPSISELQTGTRLGRSTICRALKKLRTLPMLVVNRCKTIKNCFVSNTYRLIRLVKTALRTPEKTEPDTFLPADAVPKRGVPFARKLGFFIASVRRFLRGAFLRCRGSPKNGLQG